MSIHIFQTHFQIRTLGGDKGFMRWYCMKPGSRTSLCITCISTSIKDGSHPGFGSKKGGRQWRAMWSQSLLCRPNIMNTFSYHLKLLKFAIYTTSFSYLFFFAVILKRFKLNNIERAIIRGIYKSTRRLFFQTRCLFPIVLYLLSAICCFKRVRTP